MNTEDSPLLGARSWRCELSTGDCSFEAEAEISVDPDGYTQIDIPVLPSNSRAAHLLRAELGGRTFRLVARDAYGSTFTAGRVTAMSSKMNASVGSPTRVSVGLRASRSVLRAEGDVNSIRRIQYHLTGFRCFRSHQAVTPYGKLEISGSLEAPEPGRVSGLLSLGLDPPITASSFAVARVDKYIRKVTSILSLANGATVDWNHSGLFAGSRSCCIRYRSPRTSRQRVDPVFSHLNMQPVCDLSVSQRAHHALRETGADLAIAWLIANPQYVEEQFLGPMIALEHLINKSPVPLRKRLMGKSEFKRSVRGPLLSSVQDIRLQLIESGMNEVDADYLSARFEHAIDGMNGLNFRDRLEEYLSSNGVPIEGLQSSIRELVNARNKVVHTGDHPTAHYLIRPARELIVRILLTLLGFSGRYQSYLEGAQTVEFRGQRKD